jgi:hypothetical protein
MVLLAGCTGLRVSEVMGLRWSGIDFESLVMEIRGRICSQPSHEAEVRMLPGRIAAGSGRRNHSAGMEAALPRRRKETGFSPAHGQQTLRFWLAAEESASCRSVTSQDSGTDRLAYVSSQLSCLARRNGCSSRRTTETHASCQHLNHDERLRRSLHGSEAQSQHIRRAARVGSRSHQIAKGRLVTASALRLRTLLDHFRPQSKIQFLVTL